MTTETMEYLEGGNLNYAAKRKRSMSGVRLEKELVKDEISQLHAHW